MRAALLGLGSSSGAKKPEAGLTQLPETLVRRDIDINLSEALVNSIDNTELNVRIKAMLEFNSKALILGRRVGTLFQRELKEGNWSKVEDLHSQVDKHAEEKAAWENEREEWLEERKKLGTWKVWCLESKRKLKGKFVDLEANSNELKEKHGGLETELENLKGCIIQEHINGFQKGLRHAAFFYNDVDVSDSRFDVNKDVVDGQLISEAETNPKEVVEKITEEPDANIDDVVVVEDVDEGTT